MTVTMKDIARRLNITEPAVSMALRGYPNISPETISKVKDTAKILGYRPNLAARNLRRKQSKVVGFVFPDISYDYSQRIVDGAKSVLANQGYIPMIALASWDPKQESKEIDMLLGFQTEGLICVPMVGSEPTYKRVIGEGIPLVFVGNGLDVPETSWIGLDHYDAAAKIMRHLFERGHTNIACVITDTTRKSLALNPGLQGYIDMVKDLGLTKDDRYIVTSQTGEAGSVDARIKELMLSDNRPTAIYSISDAIAYQVLDCLMKLGINVPHDCAVAGTGDLKPSNFERISLTSVSEDAYKLGVLAAQNIIKQMNDGEEVPDVIQLKGDLIIRRSTTA
jgi:DNA-binding LacI/PurR family transcriptional regulator